MELNQEELNEIKKLIQESRYDSLVFQAKIQQIGKDVKGNPRYMIYVTQATNKLKLNKGDIVRVKLEKVGHEEVRENYNKRCTENFKNAPNKLKEKKVVAEQPLKKEMEENKEFEEWKERYDKANEFVKEKMKQEGREKYGSKVDEL